MFWDGFFWERGAYIALQFGHGDSTFVRVMHALCLSFALPVNACFLALSLASAFGMYFFRWRPWGLLVPTARQL